MPSFTDCLGHTYTLRLTVADLKPLREIGLDVAKVVTAGDALPDLLFGDAERLATAAYMLSRCDLPTEEFAKGIDGPTLEAIGVALIEACVGFFPNSRIAKAMAGKVREAIDAMAENVAARISNASVGSSPASAGGSTPAS